MRKLPASDRTHILHLLCEGNSIRAITRVTGASKNTVVKLPMDAGKACAAYYDEHGSFTYAQGEKRSDRQSGTR
jgi:hypothetical protein